MAPDLGCSPAPAPSRLGSGNQRSNEFFVTTEQVLYSVAVACKGGGTV